MPIGVYPRSDGLIREITARLPHKRTDPLVRFLSKIEVQGNGCWLWKGYLNNKGYGKFSINSYPEYAHRFAYEQFRGSIPPDKEIDHLCRNHACVNPWHIRVATRQVNCLAGESPAAYAARSTHCINGHPWDLFNTHYRPDGSRYCRACGRERERKRKERQKYGNHHELAIQCRQAG